MKVGKAITLVILQAMFNIGGSTTTSRSWTIKVTQYACGDEDMGGPAGCLQYFTAETGSVASYAWSDASETTATTTHLQSQHYQNCIRRGKSMCYICYSVAIEGDSTAVDKMNSFGLSIGGSTAAV